ncbi:GDP-fucose transporter 1-like [Mercenaria mercenaria]|uniref:GDP-fucose transporter 1-like n=1 Tax=Mercenaria mercenaria TaxID=6596 RepID=UPI001E1D339E|nr:GDP-fucose transporter 1-like [Mercenaria mercenaria]
MVERLRSKLRRGESVDIEETKSEVIMGEESSSRGSYSIIAGVVMLYWAVSISLVFLNKTILSGSFGDEELTIFSAWFQSMVAVGFILSIRYGFHRCGVQARVPKIEPDHLYSKTMLMLSMSSVCGLTFNNLMLKHIGVAFYQVARSFTIIFTIGLSALVLGQGLSFRAVISCFLVVCGFFVGIDQEDVSGTLSVLGVIYGILASLSAAISGILFKKAESLLDGDSLKLAYYNNLNCMVIFLPLCLGSGQFFAVLHSDLIYLPKFWFILLITGCLSLAIGWVSALQIKYTSPIAHHLSINAKSVVQTVLAVLFYQESKTLFWWLGNFLVVAGVLMYTLTKILQDARRLQSMMGSMELPVKKPNQAINGRV